MRQHQDNLTDSQLRCEDSRRTVARIDLVLKSRTEIASSLQSMANSVAGVASNRLLALSKWFGRGVNASDVMKHPDAILYCSMLLANSESDSSIELPIHDSARDTFDKMRHQEGLHRRLAPELVYPFVLLLFSYSLIVFLSVYMVSNFEEMYKEFGLDLPFFTSVLFSLSASVRRWWIVGFVLFGLLGLLMFVVALPGRKLPGWTRILRIQSLGLRSAWIAWAWHTGWLLKSGIAQSDAIELAGSCSTEPWLRRNSVQWANVISNGERPFGQRPRGNWEPYGLLAHAFELADRNDQADVLHVFAAIHRDRANQRRLWWLSWVTPAVVVLVAISVSLLTIALYMPLVDLISGLT